MIDAAIKMTTATATSDRLAAEEEAGVATTATVEDQLIKGERLVRLKCNKIGMKNCKGLCHEHCKCKRCEFPDCENIAQRKGLCLTHGKALHGYDRKNAQHLDVALML
jgi:hypothetical protein